MPRGRLIFPFVAQIAQLDTFAMGQDPDGAGPEISGYDLDFREPVGLPVDADDQIGVTHRVEKLIEAQCQVETRTFERLAQVLGGTSPDSAIELVFHFKQLEDAGLVDPFGVATIRINDRLVSIKDLSGNVVQEVRNPPGLFVSQSLPGGFGLGPQRNLLIVTFEEREQGIQSPAR